MIKNMLGLLQAMPPPNTIRSDHGNTAYADPLSHPAIACMDARQLGDLSFDRDGRGSATIEPPIKPGKPQLAKRPASAP